MEHGDDPGPSHILIHQAIDHLREGVDILLISGDGTIALARWCFFKEMIGVQRQGRVSITPEVEPPLVPPLVGQQPLHGDVAIRPALAKLDRTAAHAHRHHLTPPYRLEEDGGIEVVLP
jgi:hypothetical protein